MKHAIPEPSNPVDERGYSGKFLMRVPKRLHAEMARAARTQGVLAPVPHRQYVFNVPRLLRPIFSRRRRLLGKLCHIVEHLLISAYSGAGVEGRAGLTGRLTVDVSLYRLADNTPVRISGK